MLTRGTWLDAIPCLFSLRPQEVCPPLCCEGELAGVGAVKDSPPCTEIIRPGLGLPSQAPR